MVIYRGDLPHLRRPQWARIERSSPPAQRETDSAEDRAVALLRWLEERSQEGGPTNMRRPTAKDL